MRLWYRFCRLVCQAAFLLVFRGRVFGTRRVPRTGGVLLVCNHQSFLDPVLATLALPRECHYLARDSLFTHPLLRRLIRSLNAFPIRRGSADVGGVKEALRRLRRGALIATFPEGTRTFDGRIGPMQAGVVLLARRANVPIVPTLIVGAYEAWPRQRRLPRPRPVIVAYGEPLWPHQMRTLSDEACVALVRRRLLAMMTHYRQHALLAGRLARPPGKPGR